VTLLDVYKELVTIAARLSALEAQHITGQSQSTDHEMRMRALERFRFTLMGAASATGALSGIISGWLAHLHGLPLRPVPGCRGGR